MRMQEELEREKHGVETRQKVLQIERSQAL